MEPQALLERDPIGLTQREMLLRLDARMERFEARVRNIEDENLVARTERKTILAIFGSIRSTILMAAAAGPIVAGIIAFFAH